VNLSARYFPSSHLSTRARGHKMARRQLTVARALFIAALALFGFLIVGLWKIVRARLSLFLIFLFQFDQSARAQGLDGIAILDSQRFSNAR
jgi:hypothetical protein